MNKLIVELIGTFFLVLTIGLTAGLGNAGIMAPLAIGSMLMVMVFAGGHISGAHYNPAVTLAVWMRGKCSTADVPGYIVAQLIGATLAAFTTLFFAGDFTFTVGAFDTTQLAIAEVLFTFALVWVVLHAATAKANDGNSFYGLAIGFTVAAGAYAAGPISGAAFNPAVVVGLCVTGMLSWSSLAVYVVAQLIGASLATVAFKAVNKDG